MTLITREILNDISIDKFQSYLLAHGWREFDRIGDKALIFCLESTSHEVIVPLYKSLGDFTLRISESIQTLSDIEQRYGLEIIKDIEKIQ